MPLQLTRDQVDEIVAHARDQTPLECCGLVGGRADRGMHVYRARNLEQSRVRYTIHPEDQLRIEREIEDDRGWELLAIYHSHPMSDAYPSPTDVAHAVESGYGEFTRFIIVSFAEPGPAGGALLLAARRPYQGGPAGHRGRPRARVRWRP